MSSSERFSWFEPPKKSKKSSSSELTFLNAPTGRSETEHVDMSQKHERDIDLHPRVLPAPLFEKLVAGEDDRQYKKRSLENVPHIPIPVERMAPEPARAEHPVYDRAEAGEASVDSKGASGDVETENRSKTEHYMPLESEPERTTELASPAAPNPIEYEQRQPEPSSFESTLYVPQPASEARTLDANEAEYHAEKRGLRRGVVAGFITGYAVKQFLEDRKQRQFEASAEQQRYSQPTPARFEQPAYQQSAPQRFEQPTPVPRPEQLPPHLTQMAEQQPVNPGEQVVLQPGQRLERRGWYSVVVDEHGREIQGALNYGEAFHREQRQEQAPPSSAGATPQDDTTQAAQEAAHLGAMGAPAVDGMLASGQVDPSHTLGQGQPHPIDPNHRLSQRQNPIIATLANPVLWLGFAVIVIAYFIVALI